jgi:hypothetical protein
LAKIGGNNERKEIQEEKEPRLNAVDVRQERREGARSVKVIPSYQPSSPPKAAERPPSQQIKKFIKKSSVERVL